MDPLGDEIFVSIDAIIMEAKQGRVPENLEMKLMQILSFLKVHGKRLEIVSRERIESLYEAFNVFNSMLMSNTAEHNGRHLLNELLELREKRWKIHENDQDFDLNELEIFDKKNLMNKGNKSISNEKNGNLPQTVQNKDVEKIPKTFNECKAICKTSYSLANHSVTIPYKENMPMKEELSIVEKKCTKFVSNDRRNMKIINWNNVVKFFGSLYLQQQEPFLSLEEGKIFQNVIKNMNNDANRMDVSSQMIIDMLNTFIRDLLVKKTSIFNPNLHNEMKTFLAKQYCCKVYNMDRALLMLNGNGQKGSEVSIKTTTFSTKCRDLSVIFLNEKTKATQIEKFSLYREQGNDDSGFGVDLSEIFTANVSEEAETVIQPVFCRKIAVEKSLCKILIDIKGVLLKKLEHLATCKIILKPVVRGLNFREILIFGFTEDVLYVAEKLIHIVMEFRIKLPKHENYSFKQIEKHNFQAANWHFEYPVNLNEQLLGNVSSSEDLTKMQQVIKHALDNLYYCKEFLLNGNMPQNYGILKKKKRIHFRLMVCSDQEKGTDEFNNYELAICEKAVVKKDVSCEMLKNASNQHVFSALEAHYEAIRVYRRNEWLLKKISLDTLRKFIDIDGIALHFIESMAHVTLKFNKKDIAADNCGSEKFLLLIVSNRRKWLTCASKIIDVIENANLSFALFLRPDGEQMIKNIVKVQTRMGCILNEIRDLQKSEINFLMKWNAFRYMKRNKNSVKKEENLNIEDGFIPVQCLHGNEKIVEDTVEKINEEELHNAIYLWKIQKLKQTLLKIQSEALAKVL
ncbi:hypothetical protein T12_12973 [Trichinella patagoniensis]|uniref:Uncharacterized protein n=1 Tax=Trichinella patagoniensis TaxID=990121 RepID=A0A0V1AGA1_9BILA|nr:hypothetical protein T12_12973 [Trichinella patagoniensis]